MAEGFIRALVVIPTRNRADLACNAIGSVLKDPRSDVVVLVSDNSTETRELAILSDFCEKRNDPRLFYVTSPQSLPMPDHWEWALQQGLQLADVSHVLFLTDRMIFKSNALNELLSLTKRLPDRVISYNHDRIDDYATPIRLEQVSWTGTLFELMSSDLLYSVSQLRWHFWVCLPRMLNCVVPLQVVKIVTERFGNLFLSTAPDFCFAYRCLERLNSFVYYDKALLVHYAQSRSNGASQARGTISKDHADFLANSKGEVLNYASPVPGLTTARNTMIHEYCVVRNESNNSKFPVINEAHYFDYIVDEINGMDDSEVKRKMRALSETFRKEKNPERVRIQDFRHGLAPVITEFQTVPLAIDYSDRNPRPKSWTLSNEETNLAIKFVMLQPSIESYVRFGWLKLANRGRILATQVRRLFGRYFLWRFQRIL